MNSPCIEHLGGDRYRCRTRGIVITTMVLPILCCSEYIDLTEARERLGISVDDMKHWAHALARWTRAGFPVRDQAEVERIERECCVPCEEYVTDDAAWVSKIVGWLSGTRYGRCKQCGCGLSTSKLSVANKIAMATESCKLLKWGESPEQPAK